MDNHLKPYPFSFFWRLQFNPLQRRITVNEQLRKNESFVLKSFVIRYAQHGSYAWVQSPYKTCELPYDILIELEKVELNRQLQNEPVPSILIATPGDCGQQVQKADYGVCFLPNQRTNAIYLDTPICKNGQLFFTVTRRKNMDRPVLHEKNQFVDIIAKGVRIPDKFRYKELSAY